MRTYDVHRGLTTALAAGVAGFLLWIATQVGQQSTQRFWATMGIVAGAGLVMAASQLLGGWTKWGSPRISKGVFVLAFLPVLVCVGWILLATQPGNGWNEGLLVDWSNAVGIGGIVHSIGLYHGVLAFAFGLVLGFSFDTTGPRRLDAATVEEAHVVDPVAAPAQDERVADEPVSAEREEIAHTDQPVVFALPEPVGTNGANGSGEAGRRVEILEGGRRVVPRPPVKYPTELD